MDQFKLLRPIGFKYKRVKEVKEEISFLPQEMKYDIWDVTLSFKGKMLKTKYSARKGDYREPRLEMVLNSFFNSSFIYQMCDNVFDFAKRFGDANTRFEDLNKWYEQTAEADKALREFFGDSFEVYDEYFRNLKPVNFMFFDKLLEEKMDVPFGMNKRGR